MAGGLVLILSSQPVMQHELVRLLEKWGYEHVLASSVDEGLAALARNQFSFSVLDAALDGANGANFLVRLQSRGDDSLPVILLCDGGTASSTLQAAVPGVAAGVPSPFTPERLYEAVKAVLSRSHRPLTGPPDHDSEARLREEIALWRSPQMQEVLQVVRQAAQVDVTVLICGETGAGKEVVARAIHHLSSRCSKPFVKVNCAALPLELLEAELFGHERGAFTGAHQLRIGKFESADHGTIFLDEIGDLHSGLQAKLLHVLQDAAFSRVGGRSTINVDVRVLAATNQNLEQAVAASRFRDDLYYRLNVIRIVVPPLRERKEEIPHRVEYLVQRCAKLFGREGFTIGQGALERLTRHNYPGNVRELEHAVKRMIVLDDPCLTKTAFPPERASNRTNGPRDPVQPPSVSLKEVGRGAARAAEREVIATVLAQTGWNRVRAAKLLKISYRALLYKIKDVGLRQETPSAESAI